MKKLTVKSNDFKIALAKLGQAVNPKSVLPILKNLLCKVSPDQMELIASNLEITIIYKLECSTNETFEFLIPYQTISDIISNNPFIPIEIEAGKKNIKVKAISDIYDIKIADKTTDFPAVPEIVRSNDIEIDIDILNCIHLALATTGVNEKRPQLVNVLLELSPGIITVASSDGAYMVYSKSFKSEQTQTQELLLSPLLIKVLKGINYVKAFYSEKNIGFESHNITIINVRSEEKFVNFRAIFPQDYPGNLKLNREALLQALNKCSLSTDRLHTTKINLESKDEVKLNASDEMINIDVVIPCQYNGTVTETAINSEKLLRILSQINSDDIILALHDAKRAIVITVLDDDGYKGMIMPIATN